MRLAGLLLIGLVAVLPACSLVGATEPSCGRPYCGTITVSQAYMSCRRPGFGYTCEGWADISFRPAPPAMGIFVNLRATSITGRAATNGRSTVRVNLGGGSVHCPFTNPTTVQVFDSTQRVLYGTDDVSWRVPGCSQ